MQGKFKQFWANRKDLIDRALDRYLPQENEKPTLLHRAMRYTLFAGGKRLRPILTLIGYKLSGGRKLSYILPQACALELIHTFSLIHDDLPAMDNDDYRRGVLASHKIFGENIAVLAGDALFNYAFKLLTRGKLPVKIKLKIIEEVINATGNQGMIGGQVIDLLSEGKVPTETLVNTIHYKKTASLIASSLIIGGYAAKVHPLRIKRYRQLATKLGLLFQIVDDILDEIGEKEKLGKSVNKDKEQGKCTYPGLYGLEASREKAETLRREIKEEVKQIWGANLGWPLLELADFIIERAY